MGKHPATSVLQAMRIEQSEFHDHLVRGLTHKMNNILSLFHGYLGLLIDDKKLDRETVAGLLRIRDSADAAAKLMDRTKAFATPSSAVWRQVPAEDFFRMLMPSLQLYAERGIQLQVTCEPGLPELWADTSRLRVAMKEIVKNACEASPANGTVQIAVKAHARPVRTRGRRAPSAPPISWTEISVTDAGKGIPANLNPKIFQPFFSTKNKRDSMGLGLSVALGLVQQLGGAIRLQSKPGKTTVKVLLPSRAR
jgi:two-component system cell cycle sensor histidine kinase/response regulator CckA